MWILSAHCCGYFIFIWVVVITGAVVDGALLYESISCQVQQYCIISDRHLSYLAEASIIFWYDFVKRQKCKNSTLEKFRPTQRHTHTRTQTKNWDIEIKFVVVSLCCHACVLALALTRKTNEDILQLMPFVAFVAATATRPASTTTTPPPPIISIRTNDTFRIFMSCKVPLSHSFNSILCDVPEWPVVSTSPYNAHNFGFTF